MTTQRSVFPSPVELADKLRHGNIAALSRAITLVESSLPEHQDLGATVMELVAKDALPSFRLGITGVPGVGKSTFIESFGHLWLDSMRQTRPASKLAVLSIDPTSVRSKGSILGDKVRMETLARRSDVFIRPSPTSGMLGGVAPATHDAMILCEAAGFNLIIVETVGVGQSELAVHSLTDGMMLLLLAGAGDDLQGVKRGIMEMADFFVITKADGDNRPSAERAKGMLQHAIHFLPKPPSEWTSEVHCVSALSGAGMAEVVSLVSRFEDHVRASGYLAQHRQEQLQSWFHSVLEALWWHDLKSLPHFETIRLSYERVVLNGQLTPRRAASEVISLLKRNMPLP